MRYDVNELASLAFDWVCRYKLDKEKSVWTHENEIMMLLINFETNPINRFIATTITLRTLYNLGWIEIKE